MNQIQTSYKVSKMLKEFLGESAPEPMDGMYIKLNISNVGPSYPRYSLHDLISKTFCRAMCETMKTRNSFMWPCYIRAAISRAYWGGGMEAVEKALTEMMEGK